MDENRVREIVREEMKTGDAIKQTTPVRELRRDVDRAIANHRPSKEALRDAIGPVLAWYGFELTER